MTDAATGGDIDDAHEYAIKTAHTRPIRVAHIRDPEADNGVRCNTLPVGSKLWTLTAADVRKRDLRVCASCNGTHERSKDPDWGAYRALKQAAEGDD